MIALVSTAVAMGMLASWIHARQWCVPYSLLPLNHILRDLIGVGFFSLLFGLVARLIARLFGAETGSVDIAGASSALIGGLLWAWLVGHNGGLLRGLIILCSGILQNETRDAAERALDRWLKKARRRNEQIYQHAVVLAVSSFCQVGGWQKALALLDTLDEANLPEEVRRICEQTRARCQSQLCLDNPAPELRL